jgi:hypothetical protein
MASFNKFQDFVKQVGKGVHQLHAAGHTLKVYLTNQLPVATDTIKGNNPGITEQNGYTPADIQNDWTESGGTGTLTGVDVEWTAGAGGFGPFQYAVIYNEIGSPLVNPLVCWWAYTSSISCAVGEKFKVDFASSILTIA